MEPVYDTIILQLDKMKDHILKIKQYNNTSNTVEYLEKLNRLSCVIQESDALTEDMWNLYLDKIPANQLSSEDKCLQKENKITKDVYNTFLPYMLYMQIVLRNK